EMDERQARAAGQERRSDAARRRARSGALPGDSAIDSQRQSEGGAALSQPQAGRDRVLQKRRLLSDHAHGGGEKRDPREKSLGRRQPGARLSAGERNLLRAQ